MVHSVRISARSVLAGTEIGHRIRLLLEHLGHFSLT